MAKDKERSINPAQQQRKLDKAKALKKGKAELQARRNEKLARRNPDRLQRQIDDLKALEASGDIKPREKAILQELERDLKAVRKARETLGDKAPQYGNKQTFRRDGETNPNTTVLGKRRYDGERKPSYNSRHESPSSDTDDSVRRIPMPEDTPPPVPREYRQTYRNEHTQPPIEAVPVAPAKTTYESAPQIRDLKKEAVGRFVPSVVRRKQDAARGTAGQLVEPEEMDRLEAEGYVRGGHVRTETNSEDSIEVPGSERIKVDHDEAKRLAEEEARFQRELAMVDDVLVDSSRIPGKSHQARHVQIEEVEDEDA